MMFGRLAMTLVNFKLSVDLTNCYFPEETDFGVELFKRVLSGSSKIREVFGVSIQDLRDFDRNGRLVSHAALLKVCCRTIRNFI